MNSSMTTSSFPNRGALSNPKNSSGSKTDPSAFKKAFGDKGLDQVLNKLSDPNYTQNKKRVRGVGNPEMGKDAFFKLMLTQLKQQDPTNPLKSHEMAAQLAQFSSVEQLTNIGQSLEKLGQKEDSSQLELLNLIGKVVSGDSSRIKRVAGDKEHGIDFELKGSAETVQVKIKDVKGKVVKEYELNNLQPGKNKIVWNGLNSEGKDLPVGDFRAEILAHNGGRKTIVNTRFKGAVDGVQFSKGGPLIVVGGKTMSLRDVKKIERPQTPSPQKIATPNSQNTASSSGLSPMANLGAQSQPLQKNTKGGPPPVPLAKASALKVYDNNKKHSKGAYENPQVLANLDQAEMSNALRSKLAGKNSLGGK